AVTAGWLQELPRTATVADADEDEDAAG
ncbi:MAG: hypothetical protein QOF28_292, partial [Actinomycetota bacterium]|nr:hypothetical protein [Actinomycetota bacterium]